MILLAIGLALFIAVHSVRIVAPDAREAAIERIGEGPWKGIYAVLSLLGLVLVGRGWGEAAREPLYGQQGWAVAALLILMPVLLVLLVAGNLPAGHIRRAARHPMMIAALGWATLHLFVNGDSAAVLLFGALAAWSAVELWPLLRREGVAALGPHGDAPPPEAAPVPWWPDIAALVGGFALYGWFVVQGHEWLFGVSPLG